jgi:hypothetical protein
MSKVGAPAPAAGQHDGGADMADGHACAVRVAQASAPIKSLCFCRMTHRPAVA